MQGLDELRNVGKAEWLGGEGEMRNDGKELGELEEGVR